MRLLILIPFVLLLAVQPALAATVLASYYGVHDGRAGRRTASGEVFNPRGMTAAHRSLPFGTMVWVSYRGRSAMVRINDRGPAAYTGRSLDLSYGAALAIGLVAVGSGWVEISQ